LLKPSVETQKYCLNCVGIKHNILSRSEMLWKGGGRKWRCSAAQNIYIWVWRGVNGLWGCLDNLKREQSQAAVQYVQVQGHVDTAKNHCCNLKDLHYLENAPKWCKNYRARNNSGWCFVKCFFLLFYFLKQRNNDNKYLQYCGERKIRELYVKESATSVQ
jgi:hypothetical protein